MDTNEVGVSPSVEGVSDETLVAASGQLVCLVCGDLSSGKHYGILACNGCSGFFKRSVRRRLIYRCQAGTGACVIDKAHRNQCQACRLKKCLQKGMNKDAVQNERQPRNSATLRPEQVHTLDSEKLLREAVGVYGLTPPTLSTTPTTVTAGPSRCRVGSELPFFFPFATHMAMSGSVDTKTSHESQQKTTVDDINDQSTPTAPSSSSLLGPLDSSASEISARLLFMAVKWTKNLTSFAALPFRDQVTLLEESWSELFVLCSIQWSLPLERATLFSASEFEMLTPNSSLLLAHLEHLLLRFKALQVNPAEFACIKAIVLFKPGTPGLKDTCQVESLQTQALSMLRSHIESHGGHSTRLERLLLLLASLRPSMAQQVEQTFFQRVIGSAKMEKLLCDMFQS